MSDKNGPYPWIQHFERSCFLPDCLSGADNLSFMCVRQMYAFMSTSIHAHEIQASYKRPGTNRKCIVFEVSTRGADPLVEPVGREKKLAGHDPAR